MSTMVFDMPDTTDLQRIKEIIRARGEKYAVSLTTLLRYIEMYEKDGNLGNKNKKREITANRILEILTQQPEVREHVRFGGKYSYYFPYMHPTVVAFCHWLFWRISQPDTIKFFKLLLSGSGLEAGHPILLLRDELIHSAARKKRDNDYWCHLIIRTWNFFREGKTPKSGIGVVLKDEKFPKPV